MGELWVCWTPPADPPGIGAAVLSFLDPETEQRLAARYPGQLLRSRALSSRHAEDARRLYVDLIAGMGIAEDGEGRTFRSKLCRRGKDSSWWYHPVAFRDSENDDAFERLIAILMIRQAAAEADASELVLWGAPKEVERVLRGIYTLRSHGARRGPSAAWYWLRGLASRLRWLIKFWGEAAAAHRHRLPTTRFKTACAGFWDWSFEKPADGAALKDRYFKALPEELERADAGPVGWFLWLDPYGQGSPKGRIMARMMAPLKGRHDVVLLQRFLSWDSSSVTFHHAYYPYF